MRKLRVLFEAGPMLDSNKTGIGYYVNHLFKSLQEMYANELELTGYYFNFLNRHGAKVPNNGDSLKYKKIWLIPGKLLSLCRRLGFQPFLEIFVRQKSDAIIFTNYVSLPQTHNRKTLLVVYDLSFLDVPEYTQERNLRYLQRFCSSSILRADVIITISEFTRERLNHHFPNLAADIIVTPIPPFSEREKKTSLGASLIDKGIKPNSYILYVGTIEPRKNLWVLVKAYENLPTNTQDKYGLVLAGGKGWKDEAILAEIERCQSNGLNIILTGYVSDEEKKALYSNASCFVLPSHYEGFGMPILEAFQYGVPCLVSDIPVFHEVAKDAAIYFDKEDPVDLSRKISSVIDSKALGHDLAQKAAKHLKTFSWEENATKIYKALR